MITTPPSERDLHAYVDHALNESERQQVELYLEAHPEVATQVHAWQLDAQNLRTALQQTLLQPANPALDPAAIRQRQRRQTARHWATAALLLLAVSVGGLGGWQAKQMAMNPSPLPMTDALAAHRMFAEQGFMPADYNVENNSDMQVWMDRYFSNAERLPDLSRAGFRPVSSRLLTTDEGGAAIVLYENPQGQHLSFYIRPPGPQNTLLPRGSRHEGDLQADYWSGPDYNYAMVGPAEGPTAQVLNTVNF